jgi:plasmid stabilization system protein ParE
MASDKPPLTVILAPTAIDELHGIWRWNAGNYSVTHADGYILYLRQKIVELAGIYAKGKAVSTRPDLHHIIIRRRNRGHGHVVVYNFNQQEVHVLHVFHTAQNWPNKLAEELG